MKKFDDLEELDGYDRISIESKIRKRYKNIRKQKRKRQNQIKTAACILGAVVVVAALLAVVFINIGKSSASSMSERDGHTLAAGADSIEQHPNNADTENMTDDSSTAEENLPKPTEKEPETPAPTQSEKPTNAPSTVPTTAPPTTAQTTAAATQPDVLNSQYAILYDMTGKKIIGGNGYYEKIYPASMTKIMTLIVAVERITDLSTTYALTQAQIDVLYKREASRAGFERGKPVSAKDCLYGLILPSGADAAVALACMAAGSEDGFAVLMNLKCQELGLKNTHFTNASGLHDENQYTTLYDMCKIMEYAMSQPLCAQVLSTQKYTTSATTKASPNGIALTNMALTKLKNKPVQGVTILAAKTGFTNAAKYCMASCAKINERQYIAVTARANSSDEYVKDAYKLYTQVLNKAA